MAIKNLIARGVGFTPGSISYIPTLGFSIGTAVVIHAPLKYTTFELAGILGMTISPTGNTIPINIVSNTPTVAPPGNKGVCFKISGGVVTIYVWNEVSAWIAK